MIRRCLLLVMLLACSPAGADASEGDDEKPEMPEPGAKVELFEGGRRVDAVLHGPLIGYAMPRGPSGRRAVVLLTKTSRPPIADDEDEESDEPGGPCDESEEESTALYQLRYEGPNPTLVLLRDDLAWDASGLDAMDLDGDGTEELLLYRPGELHVLRELGGRIGGSGPELLLSDPAIQIRPLEAGLVRRTVELDDPWLQVPGIGRVRYYRPDSGLSTLRLVAEAELPVQASYSTNALNVYSYRPSLLGRSAGQPTFAIRAETFGNERLRVLLIRPESGPDENPVEECWARFPEPERMIHQFTRLLDGEPVLLATTMPADTLSLFDEQLLRIFPLKRDRSRTGRPPRVAFKTRINNIRQLVPFLIDLDGDDREDLVLGYWKGFDNDRVVLDVHMQKDDGSFPGSPRTTGLDIEDSDGSVLVFGPDFDGDGRADLMLFAEQTMLVFRGSATMAKGKKIVEQDPVFSIPMGYAVGGGELVVALGTQGVEQFSTRRNLPPITVDLDGDGRSEVFLVRGRGRVSLVRFEP